MVGATRGNPDGFGASGSRSQQTPPPPPPPPPPPSLAEVMATQTELLWQIVQGQQPHHQQRGGHNAPQPQVAGYPKFFGKQPPLFNKTEEPLDANAWFHTIESKFALLILPCPEANKAWFAAQ
jgi:hypothetical protein